MPPKNVLFMPFSVIRQNCQSKLPKRAEGNSRLCFGLIVFDLQTSDVSFNSMIYCASARKKYKEMILFTVV